MNRRKQHHQQYQPQFHEQRKRWGDRRRRNRVLGLILVPYVRLKNWFCALLGLGYERR